MGRKRGVALTFVEPEAHRLMTPERQSAPPAVNGSAPAAPAYHIGSDSPRGRYRVEFLASAAVYIPLRNKIMSFSLGSMPKYWPALVVVGALVVAGALHNVGFNQPAKKVVDPPAPAPAPGPASLTRVSWLDDCAGTRARSVDCFTSRARSVDCFSFDLPFVARIGQPARLQFRLQQRDELSAFLGLQNRQGGSHCHVGERDAVSVPC
jgi:hypothetical protein